ncbi:MAG: hypothetical protein R6V58_00430 [Planctomycetota bacterium]
MNRLRRRSRVRLILTGLLLGASLCVTVLSCGGEERPELPPKLEVAVPAAVRKDLVAQAVELCHAAFPKTPKKWFEKQYQEYLDAPRWEVDHKAFGNGLNGPLVDLDGAADVTLSFPAARPVQGFIWDSDPPPGYAAQEVELDGALRTARATFVRLVPRAADRRDLTLRTKKLVHDFSFFFDWSGPVGPGHTDSNSVLITVRKKTGCISLFRADLRERPPEPRTPVPRERIEKKLKKLERGFESKRLGLYVNYTIAGPRLCWKYTSPRPGLRQKRTILWDATTGKRIRSNAYDAEGKRHSPGHFRAWTSPEAYPWRTKKQVVERLEKTAAERAEELTGEGE